MKSDIKEIIADLELKQKAAIKSIQTSSDDTRETGLYISAVLEATPYLCNAVKLLRNSFEEACEMADRATGERVEAERLLIWIAQDCALTPHSTIKRHIDAYFAKGKPLAIVGGGG